MSSFKKRFGSTISLQHDDTQSEKLLIPDYSHSNKEFDIERHYVSESSASEYADAHDYFPRADTGSWFFNRKVRVTSSRYNTSSYKTANENTFVGQLQKFS